MVVGGETRHNGLVHRELLQVDAPLHDVLGRALSDVSIGEVVQCLRVAALLFKFIVANKKNQ